MYMGDIKQFAKYEEEYETLILGARIYNVNIGIESSIEKCTMPIIRSGKWHMTEGIELLNQENVRTSREKETYKYLEILEVNKINQVEKKEKFKKENLRRTIKRLENKLF